MVTIWATNYKCAVCKHQHINVNELQYSDQPIYKQLKICVDCDRIKSINEEI